MEEGAKEEIFCANIATKTVVEGNKTYDLSFWAMCSTIWKHFPNWSIENRIEVKLIILNWISKTMIKMIIILYSYII